MNVSFRRRFFRQWNTQLSLAVFFCVTVEGIAYYNDYLDAGRAISYLVQVLNIGSLCFSLYYIRTGRNKSERIRAGLDKMKNRLDEITNDTNLTWLEKCAKVRELEHVPETIRVMQETEKYLNE